MSEMPKAQRLNELRARFQSGARMTIAGIADEFGITRRTANRDLLNVQTLGVEIESEELPDRTKVWFSTPGTRYFDVRYSLMDVATLMLGRRLFDFLEGTLFEEHLGRVYHRIESQIARLKDKEHVRRLSTKLFLIHEGPKRLAEESVDVLDACLDALFREHELDIVYQNAAGERSSRTVQPYTLVAYKRGLYLLGYCSREQMVRVFGIERIVQASWMKDRTFDYPKSFSPENYFEDALFIVPGDPEKIVLFFTATTEPFIRIRQYHASQSLHSLSDGRLEMNLTVPVNFELVNWLLSFGANVEVREPVRLREKVQGELQRALESYSD